MRVALVGAWRVKSNSLSFTICGSSSVDGDYATTEVVDQCRCAIDCGVESCNSCGNVVVSDRLTSEVDV